MGNKATQTGKDQRLGNEPMKKTSRILVATMAVAILIMTFLTAHFLIAGEKASMKGRFLSYENGMVLDQRSNLMWAAKDNGSNINRANAKSYCEHYRGGGFTDWRMPKLNELAGLYIASKSRRVACDPGTNIHVATELIDITCLCVWASEMSGSEAALFDFTRGKPFWAHPSHGYCGGRALPVRSF